MHDDLHAFPTHPGALTHDYGMTLRDWFAGQALVGSLSGAIFQSISDEVRVRRAFQIADAMLAQRSVR